MLMLWRVKGGVVERDFPPKRPGILFFKQSTWPFFYWIFTSVKISLAKIFSRVLESITQQEARE